MPSAIAPLDTSTTSRPVRASVRRSAPPIARARAWSSPWPSLVTRLLPTLTTRRLARGSRAVASSSSLAASLCDCACPLSRGSRRIGLRRNVHARRSMSSRQPSPVSAEMGKTGASRSCSRRRSDRDAVARAALVAASRSTLLSTSQRGLRTSAASYFRSSSTIALASRHRIAAVVERRDVDDVQQQPRAREVAQELVAEPRAFGRAFDQAGNVGDHEAAVVVDAHHAEVGVQRRERIVGDLRPRGGHRRG